MDLYCFRLSVVLREAVETKVTVDSKRTYERGPFLVDKLCFFCSVLAAQVGPVQNIFILTIYYLYSFVPIAQQAGQAAVLGSLSLSMCLWSFSKPAPRGNKEMSLTWADQ
jgi:hypothetical protein